MKEMEGAEFMRAPEQEAYLFSKLKKSRGQEAEYFWSHLLY